MSDVMADFVRLLLKADWPMGKDEHIRIVEPDVSSLLPSEIVTAPYITVFCIWFLPPDQQGQGPSPNSYASASWLFRTSLSQRSEPGP